MGLQPWSFSKSPSSAFPLFRLGTTSMLKFNYNLNLDMRNLIQMRRFNGDSWEIIPTDLSLLVGCPTGNVLPAPTLRGCFAKIRKSEYNTYKCRIPNYTMAFENTIECDAKNTHEYGEEAEIEMTTKAPCKGFYVLTENQTAKKLNCHGVYGSDSNDPFSGYTPIEYLTLSYSSSDAKFERIEPEDMLGPLTIKHYMSQPLRPGILAYPNLVDVMNMISGHSYVNAKLHVNSLTP